MSYDKPLVASGDSGHQSVLQPYFIQTVSESSMVMYNLFSFWCTSTLFGLFLIYFDRIQKDYELLRISFSTKCISNHQKDSKRIMYANIIGYKNIKNIHLFINQSSTGQLFRVINSTRLPTGSLK